ncbi:MAG: hypothetical protein IIB40_12250 [Candidatus Marinimicrobia bacterium]|nr:hypothetical protein [Candidatus Neomarinimicrobiota bacterium]
MPDLLKKKAFLIGLILVVLLAAYGIYTRTDSYQFNNAKNSGDYWEVWRFMVENPGSDLVEEAQKLALELLYEAEQGQRIFGLIYRREREVVDVDYEMLAYAKPGKEPLTSLVIGHHKFSWGSWEECKLYLLIRHKSKFNDIDDSDRNVDLIKESFKAIVNSYDSLKELSILRFGFLVDMINESGVEPDTETAKSLEVSISNYIEMLDVTPINKRSEISWEWVNLAIEYYPQKANLMPLLSGKELERMRYIHSNASYNSSEKISNLIKENKELLKIDSTYNWTPLYYGLIEYEDRTDSLERVKEEYEVADARLSEAKAALSQVSKVTVNILRKLEGNKYEAVVGGQLTIILSMLDRVLDRTGYYDLTITELSSSSGYTDSYTNMPMPLYSQYVGDYDALKKEHRVQVDKTENLKKRVKSAEVYLKEMEPIMLDLFGRVINK